MIRAETGLVGETGPRPHADAHDNQVRLEFRAVVEGHVCIVDCPRLAAKMKATQY